MDNVNCEKNILERGGGREKYVAPENLRGFFADMLYELQTQRFKACQVPDIRPTALEGKNIWIIESRNPRWYSQLIRKYPKNRFKKWKWQKKASKSLREADSRIVRRDIERILQKLSQGLPVSSIYLDDLLDIAKERLKCGEKCIADEEIYLWEVARVVITERELAKIKAVLNNLSEEMRYSFLDYIIECKKRGVEWDKEAPF